MALPTNLGINTSTVSQSLIVPQDVTAADANIKADTMQAQLPSKGSTILADLTSFVKSAAPGAESFIKAKQDQKNINEANAGTVEQLKNPLQAPDATASADAGVSPTKFAAMRKVYLNSSKEYIATEIDNAAKEALNPDVADPAAFYQDRVQGLLSGLNRDDAEEALIYQSALTTSSTVFKNKVAPEVTKKYNDAMTAESGTIIGNSIANMDFNGDIQKQLGDLDSQISPYRKLGVKASVQNKAVLDGLQSRVITDPTITVDKAIEVMNSKLSNGQTVYEYSLAQGQGDLVNSIYSAAKQNQAAIASAEEKRLSNIDAYNKEVSKQAEQEYELQFATDKAGGIEYSQESVANAIDRILNDPRLSVDGRISTLTKLASMTANSVEIEARSSLVTPESLLSNPSPDSIASYTQLKNLDKEAGEKMMNSAIIGAFDIVNTSQLTADEKEAAYGRIISTSMMHEPTGTDFVKNSIKNAISGAYFNKDGSITPGGETSVAILSSYIKDPSNKFSIQRLDLPQAMKDKMFVIGTMVDNGTSIQEAVRLLSSKDPRDRGFDPRTDRQIEDRQAADRRGDDQFFVGSTNLNEYNSGPTASGYSFEMSDRQKDKFFQRDSLERKIANVAGTIDPISDAFRDKMVAIRNSEYVAINTDNVDDLVHVPPSFRAYLANPQVNKVFGATYRNTTLLNKAIVSVTDSLAKELSSKLGATKDSLVIDYMLSNGKPVAKVRVNGVLPQPLEVDVTGALEANYNEVIKGQADNAINPKYVPLDMKLGNAAEANRKLLEIGAKGDVIKRLTSSSIEQLALKRDGKYAELDDEVKSALSKSITDAKKPVSNNSTFYGLSGVQAPPPKGSGKKQGKVVVEFTAPKVNNTSIPAPVDPKSALFSRRYTSAALPVDKNGNPTLPPPTIAGN